MDKKSTKTNTEADYSSGGPFRSLLVTFWELSDARDAGVNWERWRWGDLTYNCRVLKGGVSKGRG